MIHSLIYSHTDPMRKIEILLNKEGNIKEEWLLIDWRSSEAFAKKHVQRALNIPFGPAFMQWASLLVTKKLKVVLVGEDKEIEQKVIKAWHLARGAETLHTLLLNKESFLILPSNCCPFISIKEVKEKIEENCKSFTLLDIRSKEEWKEGHIQQATSLPLNDKSVDELNKQLDLLPKEHVIAVICRSGYRSSIGASLLKKLGFPLVYNVQGGMQQWIDQDLPLV